MIAKETFKQIEKWTENNNIIDDFRSKFDRYLPNTIPWQVRQEMEQFAVKKISDLQKEIK